MTTKTMQPTKFDTAFLENMQSIQQKIIEDFCKQLNAKKEVLVLEGINLKFKLNLTMEELITLSTNNPKQIARSINECEETFYWEQHGKSIPFITFVTASDLRDIHSSSIDPKEPFTINANLSYRFL